MTRCRICHDQTDDGPTCGAETCEVAWDLIEWASDSERIKHTIMGYPVCILCGKELTTYHQTHYPDCLHKRAAALLASRGTEAADGQS